MKHVVPTRMVAHLWAAQSQDWARNSCRNFSFQGRVLRSYSTDVARITDWRIGKHTVVLLDSYRYSGTTNRHIAYATSSLDSSKYFPFSVPITHPTDSQAHKRNAEHLYNYYQRQAAYYRNPRSRIYVGSYTEEELLERTVAELQQQLDRYNYYNKYVRKSRLPNFTVTESAKEEIHENITHSIQRNAVERERAKVRDAQRFELEQTRLVAWLAGETNTYLSSYYLDGVYLRLIERDGKRVIQTSRGAEIHEGHGQRIWAFIQMLRERGETYQHNGHTQHVGQFRVDSVDAEYTLHAGCHHIAYERMAEFAHKHWEE